MNKQWLWWGVLGCGCTDKATETGSDLPGSLQLRVAPGIESAFTIADVVDLHVILEDCTGGEAEMDAPPDVDLLFDELSIPAGQWCGIRFDFSGPLSMQGETEDFAVFEIRLDISELAVANDEPLSVSGQTFILEWGTPGWVHPPSLGIEPSSTFLLDSTHPQHDVIRRGLQAWSGLYLDTNGDFEVGDSERESGPLMSGVFSMPGPVFVAMGDDGQTLVSSDGTAWEYDQTHDGELRDSARSHGLIVAVGGDEQGIMLSSLDGDQWMPLESAGSFWMGVASNGRQVVAVGLDGHLTTSGDLVHWNAFTLEDETTPIYEEDFYAIAHGGNGFIVVGEDGVKLWSTDGQSWVKEEGTIPLYDVAWGVVVAVGEGGARKQADSSGNWATPVFGGEDLTGVAYGDGRWVAVGVGRSLISEDAQDWESHPQEINLERVAFSGGVFLGTTADALYRSADGIQWMRTEVGVESPIHWIRALP